MPESNTLAIAMDVHKESIAVPTSPKTTTLRSSPSAPLAHDTSTSINSPASSDKAQHLVLVYAAGPCGYWL
jgi:hypothetical protein